MIKYVTVAYVAQYFWLTFKLFQADIMRPRAQFRRFIAPRIRILIAFYCIYQTDVHHDREIYLISVIIILFSVA